ncbi:MAG TPA: glycosyltransferase, partial [Candidatus Aminicenantes bacterium]|nr:glycosyltransferase [Candidatus Aminicenantes bacterium]
MSVSVIIPVYNGESTLIEAVESVRSQASDSLEIIVVDDGSTDRTDAVIRTLGPKVRSFRQANAGPAAARNRGLTEARGDRIAFLDADDLWAPGKLARQLDFLERHPEVDVVQGMSHPFRDEWRDGLRLRRWLARVWSPKPDSALFRAGVFARVGPFAGDMTIGEDLDWFFRARELGVPLWKLFGASVKKLTTDITIVIGDLAQTKESCRRFYAQGFRKFKIKIGKDYDLDLKRVAAVKRIAPKCELYLDANQAFTA